MQDTSPFSREGSCSSLDQKMRGGGGGGRGAGCAHASDAVSQDWADTPELEEADDSVAQACINGLETISSRVLILIQLSQMARHLPVVTS